MITLLIGNLSTVSQETAAKHRCTYVHQHIRCYLLPNNIFRSYKATLEDDYEALDIPNHPRLALVSKEIAGESKDSFTEGTLVLMMFNPTTDTG